MTLPAGTPIGPYVVVSAIGAGGMGEVYRATDARLGRDVAIKVLPGLFARDPERLARFEQEARALAALNHPNIAQVYGFEEFRLDGSVEPHRALVMELLEGETLRERLTLTNSVGLPARKTIEYISQIARGLAAAHERGLVHRDLKPENIFVLKDGQIKILDFGLARAADVTSSGATQTMTHVAPRTDAGTVLGTVGYMAPEQVRGGPIDARTDLFALGCVLYEMLTGQRAFKRETPAETMTAILNEEPPELSVSRADLTPSLDRIVRHCLEKNPNERFQTARDVAFALNALSGSASSPTSATAQSPSFSRVSRVTLALAALSVGLAALVLWQLSTSQATAPTELPVPYRVSLPLPSGFHDPTSYFPSMRLSLSPNGRRIVIQGAVPGGEGMLWLGSLVGGGFQPIPNTVGGFGPAWAPDNKRIVFNMLRQSHTLDVDTGALTTMKDSGAGTWGADDVVLWGRTASPIWAVPATGGSYKTVLDRTDRQNYGIPWFLADGRRFVYRFWDLDRMGEAGIYRASIDGGAPVRILEDRDTTNLNVVEVSGALLFVRGTTLMGLKIDAATGAATGVPVAIAENVESRNAQGSAFTASNTGLLAYLQPSAMATSKLVWLNRKGEQVSVLGDEADYSNVELSPDGRRVLAGVTDPAARARDIYVVDVQRGVRQRLTFDVSDERSAVWSRDGRTVFFNSKGLNLYSRPSDFSGTETPVQTEGRSKDPRDISPDGKFILFRRTGDGTGNDIWMAPVDGIGEPRAIVGTAFNENYAMFSPDGKSMVYVSDESGSFDVYVMSLDGAGGRIKISADGGSFPRWRRDGKEIVYLRADGTVISVPVTGSGATFNAGAPHTLFTFRFQPGPGTPFDLTLDGERFLVNAAIPSKESQALRLIVNWPTLLEQKTN